MRMSCQFVMLTFVMSWIVNQKLQMPIMGCNASRLSRNHGHNTHSHHGKRWALLIAGSNGYWNYRHQADICHAYQILKKGGLEDENIVVFMYDDIAFNPSNPRPGIIINKPDGDDVYQGVPKDYTGENVNPSNLYAAILGDKLAIKGGSGKVIESGPNDHIFIYYADHGGPGILGMPGDSDYVYAKDLIEVLEKKHKVKGYKSMVFYLEACESGSMFEGLLPENINIYATTAANPSESSWGTYCPGFYPSAPPEYDTCLGDLYSISWMEDCDKHDLTKETLREQYEVVRRRTADGTIGTASHVKQYGNRRLNRDVLYTFLGTDPSNDNYTYSYYASYSAASEPMPSISSPVAVSVGVAQRDVDLLHYRHKFNKAPIGSQEKVEAQKKLEEEISKRTHEDHNIHNIGRLIFGHSNSSLVLNKVRHAGQPLVDDWDCFKTFVKTYEEHCGNLSRYGRKYTRAIANMCNAGVKIHRMVEASIQTCSK